MTEPDTDEEAALEPDTDADSDLEPLIERDSDLEPVIEPDSDFETDDETDGVLEAVASIDSLADTLLLILVLAVSEAVKLGETGDFVTEGVGVGDGIIAVYDIKNTDPDPRLIMLAPIWDPPEL